MLIRIVSVLGAIAATAATVAFASPAAAQAEDRSVTVSMAGLDLSSPADAARLHRRLHAAAREVCGPDNLKDAHAHQQARTCEMSALARANADVQLALRGGGSRTVTLTTN
jgi:UrcA family protein